MSYHTTSWIRCTACQARGVECQCARLDSKRRGCIGLVKTHSGLGREGTLLIDRGTTLTSSEHMIQYAAIAQNAIPPSLVGVPVGFSEQNASIGGPRAIDDLTQTRHSVDPSAVLSGVDFHDDNSYLLSPQYRGDQQHLTSPYSGNNWLGSDDYRSRMAMSPGRADCLASLFSLARPGDQLNRVSWTAQNPRLTELPRVEPELDDHLDDPDDPKNDRCEMIDFLSLDRYVESNSLPFLLHAYDTWRSHFLFESQRVTHLIRYDVFKGYTRGEEPRRILKLLANNAYEITRSANFNPDDSPSFSQTDAIIRRRLIEAGAQVQTSRELDIQYALRAMSFTYEFISSLCKVGSLSSVLSIMQLAAPVFRRACPGSLERFVNLPTLLATMTISIQSYGTLDVLLGVLTGRPMFFRYGVEFTPEAPESLFFLEDGPGIRWAYGVPGRLVLTLAKMSALLEDYGPYVKKEVVNSLEEEIKLTKPIVRPSTEPLLPAARVVVQESWFLAALVYLYMGLCGVDSKDSRVVEIRTRFMRMLTTVRPRRNPDMFLVSPMIIGSLQMIRMNEI
ncbi:unnamed protein product [Rhizoctonia solani]|uniref:Uncharacterized protein n=1 Tax=Rhizoctonia solani TaxID=456999 RepID=A0A8H2XCZ8_9AGAM|nr:unnamed protein product [Rhizoctonia solani]